MPDSRLFFLLAGDVVFADILTTPTGRSKVCAGVTIANMSSKRIKQLRKCRVAEW